MTYETKEQLFNSLYIQYDFESVGVYEIRSGTTRMGYGRFHYHFDNNIVRYHERRFKLMCKELTRESGRDLTYIIKPVLAKKFKISYHKIRKW